MKEAITIRTAVRDDAVAIHELHTRSVQELCKGAYTPEQITAWVKHRTPNMYRTRIECGGMYVAMEGAKIVGFGHAVPGEIKAIYVAPEYIRQGVGTLLLTYGIPMARHGSQGVIRLDSTLNAKEFYAQAGFVETERKSIQRSGVFLPVISMKLQDKI